MSRKKEEPINITKAEIKAAFIHHQVSQHNFRLLEIDEITANSWLENEYVDGVIRYLVGSSPQLRHRVGVLPTFDQHALLRVAHDLAYHKVLEHPQFQKLLPASSELVEVAKCKTKQELTARNREEKKRNRQDRALHAKADRVLKANHLSNEVLLKWYLQTITQQGQHLLGNQQHQQLAYAECQQLIIPFRRNNNHFTVAVIKIDGQVDIQYYDSLGGDLRRDQIEQLASFFTKQNYVTNYQCISQRDQREGYNCGVFAILKAIDLANQNAGNNEKLLPDLNQNYRQHFNYFRSLIALILNQQGYQRISLSQNLNDELKEAQNAFIHVNEKPSEKLSEKSEKSIEKPVVAKPSATPAAPSTAPLSKTVTFEVKLLWAITLGVLGCYFGLPLLLAYVSHPLYAYLGSGLCFGLGLYAFDLLPKSKAVRAQCIPHQLAKEVVTEITKEEKPKARVLAFEQQLKNAKGKLKEKSDHSRGRCLNGKEKYGL